MRDHNAALAREAGAMLADVWRSELAAAPEFSAAMVSVRLAGGVACDDGAPRRLAARLYEEHGITAAVMLLDGALWLRVSAQVYNEIGDYRRLAAIGRTLRI